MQRLLLAFTLIGIARPAWAQTAEAVKAAADAAAAIQGQGGLLGSVAILALIIAGAIITVLWLKNGSQDKEIRSLNKDLITAVRQAESTAGDSTNALKALEIENRNAAAVAGERWDAVKGMSLEITKVGMLVDGNKQGIGELKAVIEGLRTDIQNLWRRPQS